MTERITADDLQWAATWLEEYETQEPETDSAYLTAQRVARWARQEAAKREERAAVRYIVKRTGASPQHARAKLREQGGS